MKMLKILLPIIIMIFLITPVLGVSQTISFTQNSVWTCPSDVNSISLKLVGAGSGGMGGYYWYGSNTSTDYGFGTGSGGNNGTYISVENVPVVPGQSYPIIVGQPGVGYPGIYIMLYTGTTHYEYGYAGNDTTAFGYTAAGGVKPYIRSTYDGSHYIAVVLSSDTSNGKNGYGNYQIATSGLVGTGGYKSLYTSYGLPGGIGYGAGGGGGGSGSPSILYGPVLGGAGGTGAYGYAEITYNSASTQVVLIGRVIDASTSSAVSGATVSATQNGFTRATTSASDGLFTISDETLTFGVPINVTTTKSGYAADINIFTTLSSGTINLTIPMIATSYYTNTSIVGLTRDNLYGNPIPNAMYYAQDTSTSVISSTTTNTNGFADITGLEPSHFYFVWGNKSGYTAQSPKLAKPYS